MVMWVIFMHRFYSIKKIHVAEFPYRSFPLVLILGKPSFVINQWIFYLLENGITESLLEERLRGVMHLFEFTQSKYGNRTLSDDESRALVKDFLLAKKNGTENTDSDKALALNWPPLPHSTVKRYLAAINAFDKWQATFHSSSRLNPSEEKLLEAWEIYREFKNRTKWDVMLHLYSAKEKSKEVYKHSLKDEHHRFKLGKKQFPKAFPLAAFVDLVEKSPNPRDRMLWLLLFGLGLRQSEPLHIYLEDCKGTTVMGETKIMLDDPEIGEFRWFDNQGTQRRGTRRQYLTECFQNPDFANKVPQLYKLTPRSRYGGKGGMKSGFKGMSFDVSSFHQNHCGNEALWIDPRLGIYFNTCLQQYLEDNFYSKPSRWPYHPFLLINLDNSSHGLPMTLPAVKKAWYRALKRINLDHLPLGPHSLRHLCGYYCASVLKLSIETTKSLLRHSAVTSTSIYYHLTKQQVREAIFNAITSHNDSNLRQHIVFPDTPQLELPNHWAPNFTSKRGIYEVQ